MKINPIEEMRLGTLRQFLAPILNPIQKSIPPMIGRTSASTNRCVSIQFQNGPA
jgi:hypothetical protein